MGQLGDQRPGDLPPLGVCLPQRGVGVALGGILTGPAREVVETQALPSMRSAVRIVPARFGSDAGLIGAATLAFEELSAK
ncbi:MAG: hypothetical protein ACKOK7_01275 [Solirubrobacterales bacterium]